MPISGHPLHPHYHDPHLSAQSLVDLRASQRTYQGAWLRTSLANLGYAAVVLKIFEARYFSSTFLSLFSSAEEEDEPTLFDDVVSWDPLHPSLSPPPDCFPQEIIDDEPIDPPSVVPSRLRLPTPVPAPITVQKVPPVVRRPLSAVRRSNK